jgi:hypothetical protein
MQQSWLLKCGPDTVGTVTLVKGGTPHNFGKFEPGPDYARYRDSFEAMWETNRALELHRKRVDDQTVDDERDAAEARYGEASDEFGQFDFRFEDIETGEHVSIHWFEPDGEDGEVYWRFGKLPGAHVYSHVNVYNTCLNILRRRGFRLWVDVSEDEEDCFRCRDIWQAESEDASFTAHTPVELLGLAAIYDYVKPGLNPESYWWSVDGPDIWSELLNAARDNDS